MNVDGDIYLGENPPEEDVERLKAAMKEDESVKDRARALADSAGEKFRELVDEIREAQDRNSPPPMMP